MACDDDDDDDDDDDRLFKKIIFCILQIKIFQI